MPWHPYDMEGEKCYSQLDEKELGYKNFYIADKIKGGLRY